MPLKYTKIQANMSSNTMNPLPSSTDKIYRQSIFRRNHDTKNQIPNRTLIDYFSASFFLMCAMAFPGFRCFGQTLVQFIIV